MKRITPTEIGTWQAQAILDGEIQSASITFEVTPSGTPGFVRVHPENPRYLAFDDGTLFTPIGSNIAWWNSDPLTDYVRWLDHFTANGGNTIRVWMASWAFGIEWSDTPLGDYANRQYKAWLLDQLFQMAADRGIYIILALNNHGQFSTTVNPEWARNPYNAQLA